MAAEKDTEWLMSAYHAAEIFEYWLIDGRDENDLKFDLLRRGPVEYVATRKSDAWVKSAASPGDLVLRKPIVGIDRRCARAVRGHAAAAPARSLMKLRRLIVALPRRGRHIARLVQ